jgi:hypothetical protein
MNPDIPLKNLASSKICDSKNLLQTQFWDFPASINWRKKVEQHAPHNTQLRLYKLSYKDIKRVQHRCYVLCIWSFKYEVYKIKPNNSQTLELFLKI